MHPAVTAAAPLHPGAAYSRGAKWFHWATVPPLAILLLSGLVIRFINDEAKMAFYTLHESLGLLVLALALARLAWRLGHPPPPLPDHMPALERMGAEATHRLFYVLLVAQPLLGFLTTNAYGFPQRDATAFLGFIDFPQIMEARPALAATLHWAHSLVGWLLVPLLLAHVGAVVYHHAIRRDGTLLRML